MIKDHQVRALVNELTAEAERASGCQCMREVLSKVVRRHVAEFNAEQDWISMEDQSPEDGNKYLFRLSGNRIGTWYYTSHESQLMLQATHWKHLPEPPEED
jgi:hypothetical protein